MEMNLDFHVVPLILVDTLNAVEGAGLNVRPTNEQLQLNSKQTQSIWRINIQMLLLKMERNDNMTITEILTEIHKQRVELEVCQELQRWLLDDRASWIDRAMDAESTVRAIGKIAKENKNKSSAIDGIINICDSAIED